MFAFFRLLENMLHVRDVKKTKPTVITPWVWKPGRVVCSDPWTCPNCGQEWSSEKSAWRGVHWSDHVSNACQFCCRGND